MEVYKAVILGFLQGVTEFLPISSSGHLIMASKLLNVDSDLFFDILLHIATLLPVIIVFFKDVIKLFTHPVRLLYLVIATLPAGLAGLLFNDFFESAFASVKILPITFLITATMLYITDKLVKNKSKKVTALSSLFYGGMQVLALLPGISRSGTCISAGKILGIDETENLSFSFLMSIPIIIGSFFKKTMDGVGHLTYSPYMTWGFVSALIGGFVSLILLKRLSKKIGFAWYSVYLIILSASIMVFDVF